MIYAERKSPPARAGGLRKQEILKYAPEARRRALA